MIPNGGPVGDTHPVQKSSAASRASRSSSPRTLSARKALNYARVIPASLSDARYLYAAYLSTILHTLRSPSSFGTVGERLYSAHPILVRFNGISAYVRPRSEDLAILTTNHEPGVIDWFQPAPGELVVDVGAHIGTYSLRAARAGADVVAFEPNPDSFRILCANVKLNRLTRVECREVAIGSFVGSAKLHIPRVYLGRASVNFEGGRANGPSVRVARLDDEIPPTSDRPVDWLKVDVEGFEIEVLNGATELLRRTKRIVLEVSHGNEMRAENLLIDQLGFVRTQEFRQPTIDYWLLVAGGTAPS